MDDRSSAEEEQGLEERMGNLEEAEHLYQQLITKRFRPRDMKKRLTQVQSNLSKEKDESMWQRTKPVEEPAIE